MGLGEGDSATPLGGHGGADVRAGAAGSDRQSWALTFASNLELARSSRQRSRENARKTYHWSFGGYSLKPTKTGTESYSKGKLAGDKRKGEIDGAAGSAKRKFQKA